MEETAALDIVRLPFQAAQTLISDLASIASLPFVKPQNRLSTEADYLRIARDPPKTEPSRSRS
jgi:hypothetical protein